MGNRIVRNGVPIDYDVQKDRIHVSVGDYGQGDPGIALTLNYNCMGEVTDDHIEDDLEALLEVAIEKGQEEMERQQ